MIPILRAPVHLIRDGLSKEPVRYVAMSYESVNSAATRLYLYTSADGRLFRPRRVRGDLATFAASGVLSFLIYRDVAKFNGALYLGFQYRTPPSSALRALIFRSFDGIEWNRIPHPLENGSTIASYFPDVAYGAGYLCALLSDGQTVVSSDGETFTAGAPTGIATAQTLAGSENYLVAAGSAGELRVSSAPKSSWSKYDAKFGAGLISNLAAGNVFMALGSSASFSASTAPLSAPTTWTGRATVNSVAKYQGVYRPGRWFLAGLTADSFVTATDALTFSTPAEKYWDGEFARIYSWLRDDAGVMVHYGNGRIARSDIGTAWTQLPNNGLPARVFPICAYLGD